MTSIRARAVADGTTELLPADRIAALAARVRRPPEFAQAQRAFTDLQQRHGELRETLRNRMRSCTPEVVKAPTEADR